MNSIIGEETGAILFTDTADETAIEQVKLACNNEVFKDCKIRIMPDCHAGKGCVVGFTPTMTNKGKKL